jgi:septum formation protein
MAVSIILASQSPRRKQLLEWAEIAFEVIVSDADESYPPTLPPEEVAVFIARNKAKAVIDAHQPVVPVVAADTIVVCEGEILGKPIDAEDAFNILRKLSGKKHRVITGVVIHHAEREISFADTTFVTFHDLTDEQIRCYVERYKPYDKAGAYAIQEWIGVVGIQRIEGDFYNVMGLPVSRVYEILNVEF